MPFDTARYSADYLKKRKPKHALPDDDLLERYAVDPGASEAEVTAQVKAVRTYWNGMKRRTGPVGSVVKLCLSADERMKAEFGDEMLQKSWWQDKAAEQKKKAAEGLGRVVERLKSAYGELGVLTEGALDASAASYGISPQQLAAAAREAGLAVVPSKALPRPPIKPPSRFEPVEINLNVCGARTIPELLLPGSGTFRILDRYECVGNAELRLDLAAVVVQQKEVQKMGGGTANEARGEVLQFLKTAVADGVDLTELALAHLVDLARSSLPDGPIVALDHLTDLGVERTDAATIVALLEEQEAVSGAAGLTKVEQLLNEGRLGEARKVAESIPAESKEAREKSLEKVDAANKHLERLLGEIRAAVGTGEEARAELLVKQLAEVSGDHAEEALAAVPLAPVEGLRAIADENAVKVYWQPGKGHDEGTTYVVARSEEQSPPSPADGHEVARTTDVTVTDPHPPVARPTHYAVFATAPRRPSSRPATASITILPPIGNAATEIGPSEVTVRWSTHPACVGVEVYRTDPASAPELLDAQSNSCHLDGLAEGVPVHFEIVAVYRDPQGNERKSKATHVDATPRSAAKPLPKLRARPVAGRDARVRVSWVPIDSAEVRILASIAPPPWAMGTWISQEQLAGFGEVGTELSGPRGTSGADTTLEADLGIGVYHVFAVSIGGTGIVVGASTTVGVTEPIRHLSFTPFGGHAKLAWEWPESAQVAEVHTEVDDQTDLFEVTRAEYRADGGVRVELGRTDCKVEVRALVHTPSGSFASAPVALRIEVRDEAEVSYRVSSSILNRRSKTVTFTSQAGCTGAVVQVVAAPGEVMPISPEGAFVLLEERLDLAPGEPASYTVTVPKAISKPRWIRCFPADGKARLIDPPITDLKD